MSQLRLDSLELSAGLGGIYNNVLILVIDVRRENMFLNIFII